MPNKLRIYAYQEDKKMIKKRKENEEAKERKLLIM